MLKVYVEVGVKMLLSDKIVEKLGKYPIKSQDEKGENAEIILKFFNPYGRGTWYVLEAEVMANNPNDWLFFGYVESPLCEEFNEYGYFTFSELNELKIPLYINDIFMGYGQIEIDKYFGDKKMCDVL